MSKPTVFISYSHLDEEWKNRLVRHLEVLQKQGHLELWHDRMIGAGEDWERRIQEAMNAASVAILLVSADSLTSDFILRDEVSRLLDRRAREGLRIFPIVIKPCDWGAVDWLRRMNLRPKDGKPMSGGGEHEIDQAFADIAKEIRELLKRTAPPVTPTFVPLNPDEISTSRLPPLLTPYLYGRESELQLLDEAWADPHTNIVTFVAWGGVGKSAIVSHWLMRLEQENYRGAERVYA
ncbi:MAG: TIR domain-containing protein [Acidobacteria bacterium]|nr:TIR domain-containing protein [Acidobacteriota bacterium]